MKFYELQVSRAREFIELASQNKWDPIICPDHAGHQRAGRRSTELFLDVVSYNVVDFSRTMLSDFVITGKAHQVLLAAGLSGFRVESAKVEEIPAGIKRSDLPPLLEFIVTGKGGRAHKASGIVELGRWDACALVRYSAYEHGIIVNEVDYDGSDIFVVAEYPKHVLASERAKKAIESARLSNVTFVESSSLVWPSGVVKPR